MPSKTVPPSHDLTWVSLREASARARVSVSWLRKQYREHGLPTRDTVGPRGLQKSVPLEDVEARAAVFAGTKPALARDLVTPSAQATDPAGSAVGAESATIQPPAPVTFADLLVMVDRVIEVEARAARAEAEAAYLLLRLEDAFAEIEALTQRLATT